jgi:hypothetical protein
MSGKRAGGGHVPYVACVLYDIGVGVDRGVEDSAVIE